MAETALEKRVSLSIGSVMAAAGNAMKKTKEKKSKKKISYAKEFFINDKGEVIKMAAIVSTNPRILKALHDDVRIKENDITKGKKKGRTQFQTGDLQTTFISVFQIENKIKNEVSMVDPDTKQPCQFEIILFHCLNDEHKKQMMKDTQFCVVGNYLCHRHRSR